MNQSEGFPGIDTGAAGGRRTGAQHGHAASVPPRPISFDCPYCQAALEAATSQAGESLSCPHCDGVFLVPIPIAGKMSGSATGGRSSGYKGRWPPSAVMTPLQVSAIANLVVGGLYVLSLCGSFIGAGLVILGFYELKLHKEARRHSPAVFLEKASQLAIFEILAGLFNIISLPCGIINMIQTSKLKDEL